MKYFCKEKNINKGIVIEIKAPVVKISQFSPLDPKSSLSLAPGQETLNQLADHSRPIKIEE
jgi:hypothetical protein